MTPWQSEEATKILHCYLELNHDAWQAASHKASSMAAQYTHVLSRLTPRQKLTTAFSPQLEAAHFTNGC